MRGLARSSTDPVRLDLRGQRLLFDRAAAVDGPPRGVSCRHRVTVDLRGMEGRLAAFATARRMTVAASVRRAVESVASLCDHEFHFVRWGAVQTLCNIDFERGKQALIDALDDPHPHIVNAARSSISRLRQQGLIA